MKEIFKLKRLYLLLLYPITAILIIGARLGSTWVEKFFVPFVYKPVSFVIGWTVSLVPFSATELLFVFLIAGAVFYIIKMYKKPLLIVTNLLCAGAVCLFLFEICMGLNYYRAEAKEYLGLEIRESTEDELYDLCVILANDLKGSVSKMQKDSGGVSKLSQNYLQTAKIAKDSYKKLSQKYTFLKSADIRCKPLISSRIFSYFLTTGIYIPYTFESNINVDVPEFTIPATMCHELTHYRGFMRENEANFLGYLACMESENPDFIYSASLMAFGYAFPKLYDQNPDLAKKVSAILKEDIVTDLTAEDNYWEKFRNTKVSDVSDQVYDSYLNANGQTNGTKSYGEMVDLLLAYYRN